MDLVSSMVTESDGTRQAPALQRDKLEGKLTEASSSTTKLKTEAQTADDDDPISPDMRTHEHAPVSPTG